MSNYERLMAETRREREAFLAIPLVQHAVTAGASKEMYLSFLAEAYHHVKHTFPLLALTASLTKDAHYRKVLADYMEEEFGHEDWILDDIRKMGGDAKAVAAAKPRLPCRVMVAHTYYSIQWESPYAMLGMVHVLEGLSVLLADKLANVLQSKLAAPSGGGFSYLRTHGSLDIEHTRMFASLIDSITDASTVDIVIEHTRLMYHLYGAIFDDLGSLELRRAA